MPTSEGLIWCRISISIIYALATKTNWLGDDPMLWFAMMMMPVGPSAMNLVAMADVERTNEMDKMSIAKFLTVSLSAPSSNLCQPL